MFFSCVKFTVLFCHMESTFQMPYPGFPSSHGWPVHALSQFLSTMILAQHSSATLLFYLFLDNAKLILAIRPSTYFLLTLA